jgi:hypothetical protein
MLESLSISWACPCLHTATHGLPRANAGSRHPFQQAITHNVYNGRDPERSKSSITICANREEPFRFPLLSLTQKTVVEVTSLVRRIQAFSTHINPLPAPTLIPVPIYPTSSSRTELVNGLIKLTSLGIKLV